MYKKMNVILIVLNFVINLNAMENESLLPSLSSIADVSRDIDSKYNQYNTSCWPRKKNYKDIINKIDLLEQKYRNFVLEKKSEQQIKFPEEKEGYSITKLPLNNQSIKTVYAMYFDLPSYIQPNHIQRIDISHNDLEDLPLGHIVETMPNLKTLNASHNKIEYVSLRRSAGAKPNILEELNISNNALKDFNVGDFLCVYKAIKNLDLSGNPIESISWSEKICSPTEYPIINLKDITFSNDAKKKITKNYIQYLQASSLQEIESNSAVRGVFAGFSWVGTANTWAWWEMPNYSLAIVFAPTVLLAGMGYYLSKIYYSNSKQQELNDIEEKASQRLLFDNDIDTDSTDITIDM